jgi:hypothetical protein
LRASADSPSRRSRAVTAVRARSTTRSCCAPAALNYQLFLLGIPAVA